VVTVAHVEPPVPGHDVERHLGDAVPGERRRRRGEPREVEVADDQRSAAGQPRGRGRGVVDQVEHARGQVDAETGVVRRVGGDVFPNATQGAHVDQR
jgi:hypothetical protein